MKEMHEEIQQIFIQAEAKKPIQKQNIVQKFAAVRASLHDMFKLFFTLNSKFEFLPTAFAVILKPVALPIVPKIEFNLEVIMDITIFVS